MVSLRSGVRVEVSQRDENAASHYLIEQPTGPGMTSSEFMEAREFLMRRFGMSLSEANKRASVQNMQKQGYSADYIRQVMIDFHGFEGDSEVAAFLEADVRCRMEMNELLQNNLTQAFENLTSLEFDADTDDNFEDGTGLKF